MSLHELWVVRGYLIKKTQYSPNRDNSLTTLHAHGCLELDSKARGPQALLIHWPMLAASLSGETGGESPDRCNRLSFWKNLLEPR